MNKAFLIITSFLIFIPLLAHSADDPLRKEKGKTVLKDESLLIRQKNFLQRIIEDMDKSIRYMTQDIENLESRIDSITLLEPKERNIDLSSIKDGYENHLKWLYKMKEAFEHDYESYFTDASDSNEWIGRCTQIVEGYQQFQTKAKRALANYEKKKVKLVYYLNRQRFLMTETESLRNEIAALESTGDNKPPDDNYLKSLRSKLRAYQIEMNAIAPYKEEMYLHFLLLIEQLREKRDWLNIKMDEYQSLENLAKELHSGEGDELKLKYRGVISVYEKERTLLKGKVDLMGAKDWSVTPYGDIREVERFEELIDYYKLMKSRYDDYRSLLDVQADGFRADMEMKHRRN